MGLAKATTFVPYLTPDEVKQLEQVASHDRKGERDAFMIRLRFQTGLRISEALSLAPNHLEFFEGRPSASLAREENLAGWLAHTL